MLKRPNCEIQPGFPNPRRVRDMHGFGQTFIFDQPAQTFPRPFGIAGHNHRPFGQFLANMIRQGTEKAQVFLLAFGREIPANPPSGIDRTGSAGLGQRLELQHAPAGNRLNPIRIVQIQQSRRHRFVDRIDPSLLLHGKLAGLVLILDHIPT